ncbi:putative sugar O-methyltransferase [Alphaproteobacteria bacterium]|nr:putative sugar O-methyltransferase [Alphaproteobacteria bacterium]
MAVKPLLSFDKEFSCVDLRAEGFDDFKETNTLNIIKNIPIEFYLKKNLYPLLSKRLIDAVNNLARVQGRVMSYNCVKQALCLNAVEKYGLNFDGKRVAIIGDGNGYLGMLLKTLYPDVKIIQINLAKVLMFDLIFTSQIFNFDKVSVVLNSEDYRKTADLNFIPAEEVFAINLSDVDFFFSVASMQEMDMRVINSYFELIRSQNLRKTYFYCCNRVSKKLPDGTVVSFDDYPWLETDKVAFDEVCDWYSECPISRPPFVKEFDGKHKHRLIEIQC